MEKEEMIKKYHHYNKISGIHLKIVLGELYDEAIAEKEKELIFQCNQTKKFGDELLQFKKKKQNIMYENKMKKYRDETIRLKGKIAQLEKNFYKTRTENTFLRGCLGKDTTKKMVELRNKNKVLENRCDNFRIKIKELKKNERDAY